MKSMIIVLFAFILSSCADPLVRLDTTKWKSFSNDAYYILIPNDWKSYSMENYRNMFIDNTSMPNDWKKKLIQKIAGADFYLAGPLDSNGDGPSVILNIQGNQHSGGDIDWNDTIEYVKKDFEIGYKTKMIKAEKQSLNGKDYVYLEFKLKGKLTQELTHYITYVYIVPGKTYVLAFSQPESMFSSEYRNLGETILGTFREK